MSVVINDTFSHFISTSAIGIDDNVSISADGSRVDINLETPLVFSGSSLSTTLEVEGASIWNVAYNISNALNNNTFYYLFNGSSQPTMLIPDGLYSITTLNSEISRQFTNRNLTSPIILTGNLSTQKSVLTVNIGYQMDTRLFDSVGSILGFNSGLWPTIAPVLNSVSMPSQNTARFNNTNSITVLSNLVSNGIPLNNSGRNLIANIPITASIGSLISYQPINPTVVDINNLRGRSVQNFYIQICDDKAIPLPQTEPWSILLVFKQQILLSNQQVPMKNVF